MNRLGDAALVLSLLSSAAGMAAILLGEGRSLARRITAGAVCGLVAGVAVAAGALLFPLVYTVAAVTMSYALKQESPEQVVDRGAALVLGGYTFTYQGLSTSSMPGKVVTTAQVSVSQGSRPVAELRPVREVYSASGQVWTRVSIRSSLARDLYVALLDHTADGSQVLLRADVTPGVLWLWIGGGIMAAGGLLALWPRKTRSVESLG